MTEPFYTGSELIIVESDYDRTARSIKGSDSEAVRTPGLDLRQGVITDVDLSVAQCSVQLGGDTTAIPHVQYLSNYKPTVGDTCWVLVKGSDLLALDRDGRFGSAAFAGFTAGFVNTLQSRSTVAFGDLATVGPSITLDIPASGAILFGIGCSMQVVNTAAGTCAMAHAGSGANSWAAGSVVPVLQIGSGATNVGATGSVGFSTVLTGMNPGTTTITAKYGGNGGACDFTQRLIWAVPI